MRRSAFAAVVAALVVAAACSSGGSDTTSDGESGTADETASESAPAPLSPVVEEAAEGILTDDRFAAYLEEAAIVPLAASDASQPAELPTQAGGASGFSRYVYRETSSGEVVTSLVEGPLGQQLRCQNPELPCSFTELKALAESGDPIPEGLGLTPAELDALVAELAATNAAMEHYADPSTACAEGFRSDRTQSPNMGTHFFNMGRITDGGTFDPAEPEIIMYALADGAAPTGQLGQCVDGVWGGEPLEAVAVAFILLNGQTGNDHPEGYTGDFDNWHVHYNLCRGSGVDGITTEDECRAAGGQYYPTLGWMMHGWVSPEYDNQLGVFSMWNPTVWPATDPDDIHDSRTARPADFAGSTLLSIENFSFGDLDVGVGESVVVSNSDSVAHTVTSGTTLDPGRIFDSGVFAPGDAFELSFDEPGEYSFFCTLHPDMQGTINVSEN